MLKVASARLEPNDVAAFSLEYPEEEEEGDHTNVEEHDNNGQESLDTDAISANDQDSMPIQQDSQTIDSAEKFDSGPDPFDLLLDNVDENEILQRDETTNFDDEPIQDQDPYLGDMQFKSLGKSFLRPKNNDNDDDVVVVESLPLGQTSDHECPIDDLSDLFATSAMLCNGRKVKIPYKRRGRLVSKSNTFEELIKSSNIKQAATDSNYGIDICGILEEIEQEEKLKGSVSDSSSSSQTKADKVAHNGILWAEKWRPKRWIDLVGEEKTHRHIMRWLKTWSPLIFNTEAPKEQPERGWKNQTNNSSQSAAHAKDPHQDPLQRPQKKILMIHGPPGLGKTSLAHVIAAQAGYDVMEINASDERGGPIVKAKIMNALTSHRMDGRPVCIIADEIEGGAETGFIKTLVDIVIADQRACASLRQNKSSRQGKRNKPKLILRPIITICNDPYTTSLRNLRPHVELISYRRAPPERIVNRLREITKAEGLKISNMELKEIVEANCGDMRSCLNSLQFRQEDPVSAVRSKNQIKDISFDRNTIMSYVFTRHGGIDARESSQRLAKMVDCNGEYDKLASGCFTAYPHMYYHDDMVQKPSKACDWLFFHDMVNRGIYQAQQGALSQYLGESVAAFHGLFRSARNPFDKKEFTSSFFQPEFDFYENRKSNKEIEKQFVMGVCPEFLRFIKPSLASFELMPYLVKILTADVQPNAGVGSTLRAANRRAKVEHLLDVMIRLNMKLVQQRTDSGGYVYCLDPPIHNLVAFSESEGNKIAFGRFSSRQLLSQELEAEIMKREALKASARGKINPDTDKQQESTHTTDNNKNSGSAPAGKRKSQRDFFGWAKKIKSNKAGGYQDGKPPQQVEVVSLKVWIHYNEGYSNAIRKAAAWKDLW